MQNRNHYAAAVSAFIVWGFFSIPLRALHEYSSGEILYFRIGASLVILAAIILVWRRSALMHDIKRLSAMDRQEKMMRVALTLGGGLLLTINWLTFIYTVNHINVKTASFSYLICPVITAVLGYLLIAERLTTIQWVAVGLCAASCAIMGYSSVRELGYSFLTAFTYALYLITQRKNQGFDRINILGIQVLFSFLILSAFFNSLVAAVPDEGYFYELIFLIAVIFTVLPLFLNLYALNKINSATIGILMYLNPLVNFTIAFVVFREQLSGIQWMGYGIIVIALVLFNYQNLRRLQTVSS